jgi:carotenoid 1,2-hydratase
MTERGRTAVQRSARTFRVGPSQMHWDGQALHIEVDEIANPLPRRVRGTIRVFPQALSRFVAPLDSLGRHRWGPIAPCSRIEVALDTPALRWAGHAYLDSNEGDEPIDRPFVDWDWSRATLADGSTAVVYDVRPKDGAERVITQHFHPDGRHEAFEPPPRQRLPASAWRVARQLRSEAGAAVEQTLEDTPFYVRSMVDAQLLGQRVSAVHESLDLARLVSLPVQLMLPWRMPRRG